MDFDAEKLYPEHLRDTLKRVGLHKVAGAMLNVDEVTIKEAVAVIGAKAFMRRREMQKIADGINALAALSGEKTAGPGLPWGTMLSKSVAPALLGGAAATLPEMIMSQQPTNPDEMMKRFALGAALGGFGGALHNLHTNTPQDISDALKARMTAPAAQ
jgi:hypothetical protein